MPDSRDNSIRRGVVAVVCDEDRLLVIRRSQTVAAPGKLCFPGGGIEPGESETEALRREMAEELGCRFHPLRRLWESKTAWQVSLVWWYGRFEPGSRLTPNPDEVESMFWYTPAQLRQSPEVLSSNLEFLDALEAGRFTLALSP